MKLRAVLCAAAVTLLVAAAAPAVRAARYPAAIAQTHVKNWAYWGSEGEPKGVTAAWVAQHVTFAQSPAWFARPFKAAGGTYAVAYTDPVKIVTGHKEPLYDVPERGWFHDRDGKRVGRNYGSWGVQHNLNPAAPETQRAFRAQTEALARSAPYDFTEVDDVSWDLANVFYQFSGRGIEAESEAAYQRGMRALLRQSAIPPIINGLTNADQHLHDVSGDVMYLPDVAGGINNEGCLTSTDPPDETRWQFDQNTILYVARHNKWSVCWGISSITHDAHEPRMMFLASWWLTYDPRWSVAFPNFASTSNWFVFPEYEIVPTHPRQSAQANVAELKTRDGSYVREFAACYQHGRAIGACGTFVNPGLSELPLPRAAQAYAERLVLDANNSFEGGRALWARGIPPSLAPRSGIILRKPFAREAGT